MFHITLDSQSNVCSRLNVGHGLPHEQQQQNHLDLICSPYIDSLLPFSNKRSSNLSEIRWLTTISSTSIFFSLNKAHIRFHLKTLWPAFRFLFTVTIPGGWLCNSSLLMDLFKRRFLVFFFLFIALTQPIFSWSIVRFFSTCPYANLHPINFCISFRLAAWFHSNGFDSFPFSKVYPLSLSLTVSFSLSSCIIYLFCAFFHFIFFLCFFLFIYFYDLHSIRVSVSDLLLCIFRVMPYVTHVSD